MGRLRSQASSATATLMACRGYPTREDRVEDMDWSTWLKAQRRLAEAQEDTVYAPIYDETWGTIAPTHQRWFHRFLGLCPPQSLILDAACGTGKYWPMVLASGRRVFGIDQSRGMLARARAKFPHVPSEHVGLQELRCEEAFDGAVCMDALEMVCPEDWPLVLRNLARALRPTGYGYFTVEIAAEEDLEHAFVEGRRLGWPVVFGEWAQEGFYHYYPTIEQVKAWVRLARFRLIDAAAGDGYHHVLVQKP